MIAAVLASTYSVRGSRLSGPDLDHLKFVARLPPELSQRVSGSAYDGENSCVANLLLGRSPAVDNRLQPTAPAKCFINSEDDANGPPYCANVM